MVYSSYWFLFEVTQIVFLIKHAVIFPGNRFNLPGLYCSRVTFWTIGLTFPWFLSFGTLLPYSLEELTAVQLYLLILAVPWKQVFRAKRHKSILYSYLYRVSSFSQIGFILSKSYLWWRGNKKELFVDLKVSRRMEPLMKCYTFLMFKHGWFSTLALHKNHLERLRQNKTGKKKKKGLGPTPDILT